jgi:hypothetical protein
LEERGGHGATVLKEELTDNFFARELLEIYPSSSDLRLAPSKDDGGLRRVLRATESFGEVIMF